MLQVPRIAFVCLAALSLAAPAWARLGVGPSAPIEPVKIPAVRDQDQVVAADNGSLILFVWRDTRSGDGDIRGARVKPDGTVIDPNGLDLASGPGEQSEPAVSWDGTQWLVAWNDQGEIKVERVSTAGEVLDVPTTLSSGAASHPGLAWNGSVHIAVWAEGSLVHGATIDDNGFVVASGAALSLGPNDSQPSIAAAGANALVAFRSQRAGNDDVYAVRVTAALPAGVLTRLDAGDVPLVSQTDGQEFPAVASDGTKWLVAWEDLRAGNGDIRGTRVSAAGAVEDATSIAIGATSGVDKWVALTHDGSAWLATWTSTADGQLLQRVANNGNPTGPVQIVANDLPATGDGTFGGGLIVWSAPTVGETDLIGRLLGNPLGSPFLLSFQTPNQTEPAQAFGANRWMVVWLDDRYGSAGRQVRFGLTDSARFEPPNPATIAFAAERPSNDQGHPTVVFDGTNFNLFWDEQRGSRRIVVGARFTPGGAPVDTFTVAGDAWNQYEPTADFAPPGDVVLAWTDSRAGALERDLWIAQYQNGAQVSGARKALRQVAGQREEHPSLAVVQGHVVVAYETSKPGEDRGIEAAYIYFPIATSNQGHDLVAKIAGRTFNHPRVAQNGEDALIAFQEVIFSDGPALHIPKTVHWDGDDQFSHSMKTIAPGSYTPANPVIGSAGYDYLGLWSSRASGTIDLYAVAVEPGGNPVPPGLELTSDPVIDTPGSAGHGLADRAGFTYMRAMNDSTWSGLQLYGGDARDTLAGEVLINEFLAHPARGNEFVELFNTSGRDFLLNGWTIRVNGQPNVIADCDDPIILSRKGGSETNGTPCSFLGTEDYFTDTTFGTWQPPHPVEGHLPDRGAVLELFTPGGVLVDRVGYGYKGGAPVSGAIPTAIAPAALSPQLAADGDSVDLSTARIPNGTDTDNDANDWNVTNSTTPTSTNVGTAAQLGTTLFVARAYWNPSTGQPAVELLNPSTSTTYDFAGWFISNNVSTERIGVNTNAFSSMKPLDLRTLRRNEPGSFTFGMDQFSVLYLFGPDLTRYEQLGWSRPDQLAPDQCVTRLGGTGGTHDGFDWFTCGGQENVNSGELRYTTCNISSPTTDAPVPGVSTLAFAGSFPNPSRSSQGSVLVFTVPGLTGGQPVHARLSLYDVAGRRVATLVDGAFAPGTQRVPLERVDAARRAIRAGTYYADLEVGGQRLRKTLVFLD